MARTKWTPRNQAEAKLRYNGGTIGQLEALAGIEQDHASRFEFWRPFARIEGNGAFDAACASLYDRVQARVDAGELSLI